MKSLRKVTSLFLVVVMLAGMIAMQGTTVQAAKAKKVQLNKKKVTLEVGKTVALKLKNAPKKKKITWSSNKKKVASVSKKGIVTAKKAGKANVTAKVSGKKYVCKVVVKGKTKQTTTEATTQQNVTTQQSATTETSKSTTPTNTSPVLISDLRLLNDYDNRVWYVGDRETISLAASPENATNKNIEWTVSEPGVLELTPKGLSADIKIIRKGFTWITAKTTDGSNKEVSFSIDVYGANITFYTTNPDYEYIFARWSEDDMRYSDGNAEEFSGNVPWEKLKSTLTYEVPQGYTATYQDYTDANWVYTKGYIDVKDQTGKMVDRRYIIYYVNDLKCLSMNENDQVTCNIFDSEYLGCSSIYLKGKVPWSEVDKSKLHFTCNKEDFEIVPDWKEDSLNSEVGYLYINGKGEKTACEKYQVFYDNLGCKIDKIKCQKEDYLKSYDCGYGDIDIYGFSSWDDIKDELVYYQEDDSEDDLKKLTTCYDDKKPEEEEYCATLNVMDGGVVVRQYKIKYKRIYRLSYNSQYKDLGISNIDVEYEDETDAPSIRIYSSEQLDPATVVEQLDFKCIDSPNARCEYGYNKYDGKYISLYEGNTMIAFWHILIP